LHSSQCNMLGSEAFVCMVLHVHPLLKLLVVVGVALHASYVEHRQHRYRLLACHSARLEY
jgi:hypothetical protein